MSADPHLLPDGSTSWGPDPGEPSALTAMPVAYGRVLAGSVPEPTEAMVEAMRDAIGGRSKLSEAYKPMLEAAIAAAPPEWLIRCALSEEEIDAAVSGIATFLDVCSGGPFPAYEAAEAKLSRALRGGEENDA